MPQQNGAAGDEHSRPERILVFAGGNALGSYQAGAFETLARQGWMPDWVAGTSIGSINAAIVAGNKPDAVVAKLREFWAAAADPQDLGLAPPDGEMRRWYNLFSALQTFAMGRQNLFRPRWWTELPALPGRPRSLFERRPLLETFRRVIDFGQLNSGEIRFTLNSVDLASGEEVFFDNRRDRIAPEHLLASSALPPDFEPVEIGGRLLADGGLVSNTPLNAIFAEPWRDGTLCIVVDLFSRAGPVGSESLLERRSDILFASQTETLIRGFRERQRLRGVIQQLVGRLAEEVHGEAEMQRLAAEADAAGCRLVHLAYAPRYAEPMTKTYDYSRATLEDRWSTGRQEMAQVLGRLQTMAPPSAGLVVHTFPEQPAVA